jgi:MFS family permease
MLSLILNSKLNINLSTTGKVISILTVVEIVGIYMGGIIGDRIGSVKAILVLQVLSSIVFAISVFVPTSYLLFISVTLGIFFAMASGPSMDVLVSKSVDDQGQNKVFSLCYLGTNIGYCTFLLIVTYLFDNYMNIVCLLAFISNFIIIFCIFYYNNRYEENYNNTVNKIQETPVNLIYVMKKYILFFSAIFMFCIVYSQYGFTIPLDLSNSLSSEGIKIYGQLGVINACMVIICTPIFTRKFEHLENSKVLIYAGISYIISFGILLLSNVSRYSYILWIICFTIGEILYSISVSSYISKNTSILCRSRVYSMTNICVLIGYMFGQNIVGLVEQNTMKINWFIMCLISMIATLICRFILGKNYNMEKINEKENY